MNINPKILHSIDQMISDAIMEMEYYGEFYQFVNFKNDLDIPTCGVNFDLQGPAFYYNEDFVDSLEQEEMNFVMIHEIFHLLWDHQSRIRRGGFDQEFSNIIQDMIINNVIIIDVIGFMKKKKLEVFVKIPVRDGKIFVYTKPKEYKGQMIFEEMYEWLMEQRNLYLKWKEIGGECPISDYIKKIFEDYDSNEIIYLDKHMDSIIPEEFKKDLIDGIKKILKSRGLDKNNIVSSLNKLTYHKKDYLKQIKMGTNELFGDNKTKTITKRNRRSIEGLKGKRKENYELNALIDTSSSMDGYWEKTLSYIFQNDIKVNVIMCDTEVRKHTTIKNKRELQKIEILGLGGTKLTPGIRYISEDKKLKKLNLIILTDGSTDTLNFNGYEGKVLILSVGEKCSYINSKKVKQIIIK